jgi:predicted DNA-binding transcriptional regulator AlpA
MRRRRETMTTNLITSPEAAKHLGVKPQTIRTWRLKGIGPRYIRTGMAFNARVLYRREDIEAWLEKRSYTSTAEEAVCRAVARGGK